MAAIRADPSPDPSVATSRLTVQPNSWRVDFITLAKVACFRNTDPSTATVNGTFSRFSQIA